MLGDPIIAALITAGVSAIAIIQNVISNKIKGRYKAKLTEHPYFNRMDIFKEHINKTFVYRNKAKELLFKDLVWNYITIQQQCLYKFTEDILKLNELDDISLFNKIINTLHEITIREHTYFLSNESYTSDEAAALSIVIKKLDIWKCCKEEALHNSLEMISNSPFYNDFKVKSAVMLDLLLGSTVELVNDVGNTLSCLNGDLKCLTFKNTKF